jgi:hypothetical protein
MGTRVEWTTGERTPCATTTHGDNIVKELFDGAVSDIAVHDRVTIGFVVGYVAFAVIIEDMDSR